MFFKQFCQLNLFVCVLLFKFDFGYFLKIFFIFRVNLHNNPHNIAQINQTTANPKQKQTIYRINQLKAIFSLVFLALFSRIFGGICIAAVSVLLFFNCKCSEQYKPICSLAYMPRSNRHTHAATYEYKCGLNSDNGDNNMYVHIDRTVYRLLYTTIE